MYTWQQMTPRVRAEALSFRKCQDLPWHRPPHRESDRTTSYLFTAACYNHAPVIGRSAARMAEFEDVLITTIRHECQELFAWVVLPNHYHVVARTLDCFQTLKALGQMHGRTSCTWNGEDDRRGRTVWYKVAETAMKSERHFWATVNYIHHNPVKHRYVKKWQEWPFSSAANFIEENGKAEAERLWREYPVDRYGDGWDEM